LSDGGALHAFDASNNKKGPKLTHTIRSSSNRVLRRSGGIARRKRPKAGKCGVDGNLASNKLRPAGALPKVEGL